MVKKILKKNKMIITLTILIFPLLTALFLSPVKAESSVEFIDDFSTDTGLWTYHGDAYRDEVNEYVVLTENEASQGGILWFRLDYDCPFTIEFKLKVGERGADGMVFMFYKTRNYIPAIGGRLMFSDWDEEAPGYGVEFDHYENGYDTSGNHIALIKGISSNHLIQVDTLFNDFEWHQVRIVVGTNTVNVELDGGQIIDWTGEIDRSNTNIGFGASTGYNSGWHIIDGVHLMYECPVGGEVLQRNPLTVATPWITATIAAIAVGAGISKKIFN